MQVARPPPGYDLVGKESTNCVQAILKSASRFDFSKRFLWVSIDRWELRALGFRFFWLLILIWKQEHSQQGRHSLVLDVPSPHFL